MVPQYLCIWHFLLDLTEETWHAGGLMAHSAHDRVHLNDFATVCVTKLPHHVSATFACANGVVHMFMDGSTAAGLGTGRIGNSTFMHLSR